MNSNDTLSSFDAPMKSAHNTQWGRRATWAWHDGPGDHSTQLIHGSSSGSKCFCVVIHWIVSVGSCFSYKHTLHCLSWALRRAASCSSIAPAVQHVIKVILYWFFGIVMNVVRALLDAHESEHYARLARVSLCVFLFHLCETWYKCPFACKKIFTMRVLCQFGWQPRVWVRDENFNIDAGLLNAYHVMWVRW